MLRGGAGGPRGDAALGWGGGLWHLGGKHTKGSGLLPAGGLQGRKCGAPGGVKDQGPPEGGV